MARQLTPEELNEEIHFFREVCGYSESRTEMRLGLADGTLATRRQRAARKARAETGLSEAA